MWAIGIGMGTLITENLRTYRIYIAMLARCENPHHKSYPNYGGRGIKVCDEWKESFRCFFNDMGSHIIGMTLERIDNNLGYSKENCKWATAKENARNTRRNHFLTFKGKTACISEWAEICGIHKTTLQLRIKHGWSVENALTIPVCRKKVGDLSPAALLQKAGLA